MFPKINTEQKGLISILSLPKEGSDADGVTM